MDKGSAGGSAGDRTKPDFGISLDLDVLNHAEEARVDSPEPGGPLKSKLVEMPGTLKSNPNFLAMEMIEPGLSISRNHVIPALRATALQLACQTLCAGMTS